MNVNPFMHTGAHAIRWEVHTRTHTRTRTSDDNEIDYNKIIIQQLIHIHNIMQMHTCASPTATDV